MKKKLLKKSTEVGDFDRTLFNLLILYFNFKLDLVDFFKSEIARLYILFHIFQQIFSKFFRKEGMKQYSWKNTAKLNTFVDFVYFLK